MLTRSAALAIVLALAATTPATTRQMTAQPAAFDVIIRGGTVYDGTGAPGRRADVGIRGDRIAAVGDLAAATAATTVDATGLAVAPGFINMLSWSTESLLVDGRSQGEHPAGGHARDLRRRQLDGPAQPRHEEAHGRADGRPQVRHHLDDAGGVSGDARDSAACRPTWPRSSARRRSASTSSASKTGSRRRRSSTRCARSCGGRWKRARSASARR